MLSSDKGNIAAICIFSLLIVIIIIMIIALLELYFDENNKIVLFGEEPHHMATIQSFENTLAGSKATWCMIPLWKYYGDAATMQTKPPLIIAAVEPLLDYYSKHQRTEEDLNILLSKEGKIKDFHAINQLVEDFGQSHIPALRRFEEFMKCRII